MPFSVDSQYSYAKQYYAAWRSDTEERERSRGARDSQPAVDSPITHVVADGLRRQNRCRMRRACSPAAGGSRWTSATRRPWPRRSRDAAGGHDGTAANRTARFGRGCRAVDHADARCSPATCIYFPRRTSTISPAPCRTGTCSGKSRTPRCDVAGASRTRNFGNRVVRRARANRSGDREISRQNGTARVRRSRKRTAFSLSLIARRAQRGPVRSRALNRRSAAVRCTNVPTALRLLFEALHDCRSSLRLTNARLLPFVRHQATHTPQMP